MAKITALFILVAFMQVSAKSYSQVGKIDLSVNNATLVDVFQQIENESEYRFFYDNEQVDLSKKVSVNTEDKELSELLNELFLDTDLTYEMMDNLILVKSKTQVKESVSTAIADQGQITGKVTDVNGEPLPGVTVVIKGTTNGTITDIDGGYIIPNAPEDGILEFSFVGMRAQKVEIAGQSSINVTLIEDMIGIEEVVAIGYGTQKKETVTGAITTVASEEIMASPVTKLTDGLAGKLSGVIINQRGGEPGRTTTEIFIRGRSTIDAADNDGDGEPDYNSTSPLYVIDGIARDYNGLDRLDPNEIESITVLKDASAAIYGSRAANGVILITTKRGRVGKPSLQFSYNHGFSSPTRVMNMMSSGQYAEMVNLRNEIYGLDARWSDEEVQKFYNGSDPVNYPNTDWFDAVYANVKHQDKANLSVSGGSEKVKYFIAGGYMKQDSPFEDGFSYNKQYNLRSNIDATINQNLTVSLDLSGRLDDILSSDQDYAHITLGYPYISPLNPDGTYTNARTGKNALQMAQDKEYGYTSTDGGVFTSSLSAVWKLPWVSGLSLSGTFAYDYNKQYEKDYSGVVYYYNYDADTGEYTKYTGSNAASPNLAVGFNQGVSQTSNLRLAYVNTFNKVHNVDAFIGYEQNETHSDMLSAGRSEFLSGAIHELFAGTADKSKQSNDGSAYETARQHYFGRVQYDYANKYMFQFQLRRDGSQNFASDMRWGWFPGVSAGWTITEESFMSGMESLDFMKLRASWGQLGNDNVAPFQYLTAYAYGNNATFGGTTYQGLVQSGVANPEITWEVATTIDLGLETRLYGGKLGFDVDLFKTKRDNILATRNASVPWYTGLELPDENIGVVENKGIEIVATHRGEIKDWNYSLSGNFTYVKNTILDIDEVPNAEEYQNQTGKPVGAPLLYEVIGIFDDENDIASYPHLAGTIPGDPIRKDVNNDGEINTLDMVRQDWTDSPEIIFGLNMNFSYKAFDLSMNWQGQARARIAGLPTIYYYDPVSWGNFPVYLYENGWTYDNPNGTKPSPALNSSSTVSGTTFQYFNGAFLRLKNAELAYNLPKSATSILGVNACRIYVSGYNLFSIDALKDLNIDPETTSLNTPPPDRIINVGFSLTF